MKNNPPLDIIKFASIENEQLLVSLANNQEELALHSHVQGLYEAALNHTEIGMNEMVILQLLVFIHYHFLFSNMCLMRCHLSEAYASTRAAIDAALIAAVIIDDRSKQVEYATRKRPFNGGLNNYLKGLITGNKPLPHRLVPTLLELYGKFSIFASHADIGSFVHRVTIDKTSSQQDLIFVEYFQFAKNKTERKIHNLTLLHVYVMLLDIFASFFVVEEKLLPDTWFMEMQELGAYIERHLKVLQTELSVEQETVPV
jgi:hypothetical protein